MPAGGIGTTVSVGNVSEEVYYLRDRVRRLETIVEEMRNMMLAAAIANTAAPPAPLVGHPPGAPESK